MVNLSVIENLDAVQPEPGITVSQSGRGWLLRAAQIVPVAREDVFPFFADAANLGRITPPDMGFHIITPAPIAMREGTLIDYRIRLWAIRLGWRTLISEWDPPLEFTDEQVRGPYAEWIHRHRFTPTPDGGTLVEDEVRFCLPFGRVGSLGAPLVTRQLRRIFSYRQRVIARSFGAEDQGPGTTAPPPGGTASPSVPRCRAP